MALLRPGLLELTLVTLGDDVRPPGGRGIREEACLFAAVPEGRRDRLKEALADVLPCLLVFAAPAGPLQGNLPRGCYVSSPSDSAKGLRDEARED